MANDSFDLEMDGWTNDAEELQGSEELRKKKMHLSLSHHEGVSPLQDATNCRFSKPANSSDLHDAAKGVIPAKPQWAIKTLLGP